MILNTLIIFACIAAGLQYAGQVLIGKSIGEGNLDQAYYYRKIVCIIGVIIALATSSMVYLGRFAIASFFTDIPHIHEMMTKTFELVAIVEFFSSC